MKHPTTAAGKLHMIVELLREPEECECENCGNKHMAGGGLFAALSKEEKDKLRKELIEALNKK